MNFLRNTRADSSANTPKPAVAVEANPVLASPFLTVFTEAVGVAWLLVLTTSSFPLSLLSLLSFCPKMFRVSFWVVSFKALFMSRVGCSSWTKASPLSDFISSFLSDGAGVTGTGVFWFEGTVLPSFTIVYKLKWLVKNVSFPSL